MMKNGYEMTSMKIIPIILGLIFVASSLYLWGVPIASNVAIASIMFFGIAILFFEVGWQSWTDGKWNFVEILSLAVIVFTTIYAFGLLLSYPFDPSGLMAKLVPYIMGILGISVAVQGYKL